MHLDLRCKHALLLQGPVGPFFGRFGDELRGRGIKVTKVNFNAGDALFYRPGRDRDVIAYKGRLEDWAESFRTIVTERGVDAIFLFGDCRPIHRPAVQLAGELGIAVWVFEEGYLRPDYVTLERDGVNGNSRLPKDPGFYRKATAGLPAAPEPLPLGNTFYHHMLWTILHSIALTFCCWLYPRYRHHRNANTFVQAFSWTRGAIRKLRYRFRERGVLDRLVRDHDGRYVVVPLQVHCDSQLSHSKYASMEAFIEEVVRTFVTNAPAEQLLVVKHHPHDTPYRDYTRYLRDLGRRFGCADRLVYVHDLHLPTLLKHARAVVTMNSTVGTSALYHRAPVKVMGRAIYDIPGLTCQRPLAEFFVEPGQVDSELYERFNRWLRATNQVNGSFYKRVGALGTVSGLDPGAFGTRSRVPASKLASGAPDSSVAGPAPARAGPVVIDELERRDHVAP